MRSWKDDQNKLPTIIHESDKCKQETQLEIYVNKETRSGERGEERYYQKLDTHNIGERKRQLFRSHREQN